MLETRQKVTFKIKLKLVTSASQHECETFPCLHTSRNTHGSRGTGSLAIGVIVGKNAQCLIVFKLVGYVRHVVNDEMDAVNRSVVVDVVRHGIVQLDDVAGRVHRKELIFNWCIAHATHAAFSLGQVAGVESHLIMGNQWHVNTPAHAHPTSIVSVLGHGVF